MTYRARRPFEPDEKPEPIFKKPRNLNIEMPGIVTLKIKEIAQKRAREAKLVAEDMGIEYDCALKIVDGQWCQERALRESRRRRRRAAARLRDPGSRAVGAPQKRA